MKLVNLTPHTILLPNGETIVASGYVARANMKSMQVGEIDGVPLFASEVESISNVPEPKKDVAFIVPAVVRVHLSARRDLLSPTRLLRGARGEIVGCGAFEVNK